MFLIPERKKKTPFFFSSGTVASGTLVTQCQSDVSVLIIRYTFRRILQRSAQQQLVKTVKKGFRLCKQMYVEMYHSSTSTEQLQLSFSNLFYHLDEMMKCPTFV